MTRRWMQVFAAGLLLAGIPSSEGSARKAAAARTSSVAKTQSVGEKIAAAKGLLDINTATAEELKALPGMGAEYVRRVIAGRPYSAKNQLMQRGVLPGDEYVRIKELIVAHRVKK